MKPIPDKAEIVLEYPDKFYSGTFERSSRFDARMEESGIALSFSQGGRPGERKSVRMHLHSALFAEILSELAKTAPSVAADPSLRDALAQAASAFAAALRSGEGAAPAAQDDDVGDMTAEEEVTLLHVLE
jgi:truncated hemoglobin YjbI